MRKLRRAYWVGAMLTISGVLALAASVCVLAQQANKPAFVIVERLSTTGPESIQEQYGKVSREIVAKFGGRYLARSQHNELLEGDSSTPCCIAIVVPECGGSEELVRFTGKSGCCKDPAQRRNFPDHFGGRAVLIRTELHGPAVASNSFENNNGRRARQRLP